MKAIRLLFLFVVALTLASCGGGGGTGPAISLTGRVLNVESGGPTNPSSSVQASGTSALTSVVDGSFSLSAPRGTSAVTVDTLGSFGVWSFTFPSASATTDIGDLWVGPQRITVTGTVRNAADSSPINGARVSFAGRAATTGSDGKFTLLEVAYSTANSAAFAGIVGSSTATSFFLSNFTSGSLEPVGGTLVLDDILMTPASDPTPPPPPYSIWGRVSPSLSAPGTIVTLKEAGTPVRIYNVGADGFYYFWVGAGSYTIEYVKGSLTAPTESVNLPDNSTIVRKDVTLG